MSDMQTSLARQKPEASSDELTFLPPADIYETDTAIVMLLDMPGAEPGGLDVQLEKRVLSISARSKPFTPPDGYAELYAEFETGNFRRALTLPDEIDREKIEASLKHGVLRLTLPKTAPSPAKKIPVKAS